MEVRKALIDCLAVDPPKAAKMVWRDDVFEIRQVDRLKVFWKGLKHPLRGIHAHQITWPGARPEKRKCRDRYIVTTDHSLPPAVVHLLLRQRWEIENNAHWVLTTTWKEKHLPTCSVGGIRNGLLTQAIAFNLVEIFYKRQKKASWSVHQDGFRSFVESLLDDLIEKPFDPPWLGNPRASPT